MDSVWFDLIFHVRHETWSRVKLNLNPLPREDGKLIIAVVSIKNIHCSTHIMINLKGSLKEYLLIFVFCLSQFFSRLFLLVLKYMLCSIFGPKDIKKIDGMVLAYRI